VGAAAGAGTMESAQGSFAMGLSKDRDKRERQLANLIPCKPGETRNPGGRPKKLTRILEAVLSERVPHDKKRRTRARKFVESVVDRATKRSDSLAKEVFDRSEGKVQTPIEVSGPDGAAIPMTIEGIDERIGELIRRAQERASGTRA
jgi:hypothetical protein